MDFNQILKQAQQMQKQMEKMNAEIATHKYEGTASNGLVKVVINGNNEVESFTLDPSILNPEDKEMIEDLLMIAVNEALKKADEEKASGLSSVAGGLKF